MIKYIQTLLNITKYLYIKAINLPKLGQPKRDNSMLIKRYWKSILQATLSKVRITNLFKQKKGKKFPNNYILSIFFYIVKNIQKCLRTRNSIRIFNFVRGLRIDLDVLFKNSESSDYRKVWGLGKTLVHKPKGIWKSFSSDASQQSALSGEEYVKAKLKELYVQIENFVNTEKRIEKLSEILKIPEFLEKCYNKVKLSETSFGEINKNWFHEVSERIVKGNISLSPIKKKVNFKHQNNNSSLEILHPKNKIIYEAIKQLLDIIFKKLFEKNSYGFQSEKNYHNTLSKIRIQMSSVKWFIKGNTTEYYNKINSSILVSKLEKIINDQPFIDIIYKILNSEYRKFSNYKYCLKADLSQKKAINSILTNIYLYELDIAMLGIAEEFNNNSKKKEISLNQTQKFFNSVVNKNNQLKVAEDIYFKKMVYIRYANSFLIGVIGSKKDCAQIKIKIAKIFQNIFQLTLNLDKIKILHASTDGVYFLRYNICIPDVNKHKVMYLQKRNSKNLILQPIIEAPTNEVIKKLAQAGYCKKSGNPTRCGKLIHKPLHEIIKVYLQCQEELLNYYKQASNYKHFAVKIHHILKYSCALTFASKLKLKTLKKVFKKFGKNLTVFIDKDKKNWVMYPNKFFCKIKN